MQMKKGRIFLIGAGPGDPGLITVKAVAVLKKADVVLYDYLVNKIILDHTKPDAQKIYVGKKSNCHTVKQDDICDLILTHAEQGKIVARLKGGDPFVFGRGGEEAEYLAEHDIPFEVIPGVTSAIAVPAYAGIPVTHRKLSSSVTIVTGHHSIDNPDDTIDWHSIARINGTLVILMSVTNLKNMVIRLLQNGKPPETPVACISWGCHKHQKIFTGVLENITDIAQKEELKPPAVIVIGDVVTLAEKLGGWFENSWEM